MEEKHIVALTKQEQHLLVRCMTEVRNGVLQAGRPTRAIDDLLLKVIDAPKKKGKHMVDHAAR